MHLIGYVRNIIYVIYDLRFFCFIIFVVHAMDTTPIVKTIQNNGMCIISVCNLVLAILSLNIVFTVSVSSVPFLSTMHVPNFNAPHNNSVWA